MISRLMFAAPVLAANAPALDLMAALLFLAGGISLAAGIAILLRSPESEFERFLISSRK